MVNQVIGAGICGFWHPIASSSLTQEVLTSIIRCHHQGAKHIFSTVLVFLFPPPLPIAFCSSIHSPRMLHFTIMRCWAAVQHRHLEMDGDSCTALSGMLKDIVFMEAGLRRRGEIKSLTTHRSHCPSKMVILSVHPR